MHPTPPPTSSNPRLSIQRGQPPALPQDPPAAVIFDCDGVLLDTESAWAEVQAEIFARHGLVYGPEQERRMMGWSARSVAQEVVSLSGRDLAGVLADLLATETRIVTGRMPLISGAFETVQRASDHVPTAVASNSTGKILNTKMRTSGIAELVQTWVSSDDVEHGKPAPEMYLEAARRLGVEARHCLAVEDSPAGATAAVSAGMATVGIAAANGEQPPASVLISSMSDPELDRIFSAWGW